MRVLVLLNQGGIGNDAAAWAYPISVSSVILALIMGIDYAGGSNPHVNSVSTSNFIPFFGVGGMRGYCFVIGL